VEDESRTFNTERVAMLELSFMLDIAETIVNSALREKSRAARTSAPIFPRVTISVFSRTRSQRGSPTAQFESRICR